jgi:hypothetical protein
MPRIKCEKRVKSGLRGLGFPRAHQRGSCCNPALGYDALRWRSRGVFDPSFSPSTEKLTRKSYQHTHGPSEPMHPRCIALSTTTNEVQAKSAASRE